MIIQQLKRIDLWNAEAKTCMFAVCDGGGMAWHSRYTLCLLEAEAYTPTHLNAE